MNIAFLFNSDYPDFKGSYGPPIMELILKTKILNRKKET